MPYADPATRERLNEGGAPETGGELNFVLTGLLLTRPPHKWEQSLLDECLDFLGPPSDYTYERFNTVFGALACCGMEYHRRMQHRVPEELMGFLRRTHGNLITTLYADHLAPYEDQKIAANGDVYPTA